MKKILLLLSLAFITTAMACSKQEQQSANHQNNEQPAPKPDDNNTSGTSTNTTNQTTNTMKITIGNTVFKVALADNETAKAFKTKLPLTLQMNDYGGFEKIANIGNLTRNDKLEASLSAGDLMLYSGNTLVLFYGNHGGYSYTRIGKVENAAALRNALGSGSVTVKFELE
ncbi:hypothetical protein RCZ04_05460 [Capnocytophaga sp. HP1101]